MQEKWTLNLKFCNQLSRVLVEPRLNVSLSLKNYMYIEMTVGLICLLLMEISQKLDTSVVFLTGSKVAVIKLTSS